MARRVVRTSLAHLATRAGLATNITQHDIFCALMPVPTHKRLACAQAESAWLDLRAGIEKTKRLIKEAKAQGADILVLPELWLPG